MNSKKYRDQNKSSSSLYYLLFIVYYLLFIIYYLLFIVYYLLFIIYCLLFIKGLHLMIVKLS
jgi:hypothetical protein